MKHITDLKFTDLKLIDEFCCDYRLQLGLSWAEFESYSNLTSYAMDRLRKAWSSGEMESITLGLSNYFAQEATKHPDAPERWQTDGWELAHSPPPLKPAAVWARQHGGEWQLLPWNQALFLRLYYEQHGAWPPADLDLYEWKRSRT